MMADVTEDEIIEVCSFVTNKMIENLEDFLDSIKDFKSEYISGDNGNFIDLIRSSNDIQEWQKIFMEDISKVISKNDNFLETNNEEIEQLKQSQNNILVEIAKNEKEVKFLKGKLSNIKKKEENLGNMRDEIQMYKLLTNTTFTYKGTNISGYITGKKIECFEFDPEMMPKNEITNNLYDKLKKVSGDGKYNEIE